MKHTISSAFTLLLTLCLLFGSLSVSAAYEWQDGVLPTDWERTPTEAEEVTATHLLTPNNPNATQEAKNLLAYMQYVGNSTERIITGNFDYQADETVWNQIEGQYGVNPALYSTFYQINGSNGSGSDANAQLLDIINMDEVNTVAKKHYDDGCILLLFNGSYETIFTDYIVQNGIADSADDGCMHFDLTNPDRNMEVYALWKRYVDNITTALKDLESRGVKAYMYRHFLEFGQSSRRVNGCTEEGYQAFIRVQQQFFQAFVDAGLKGFLTTWAPMGWNQGALTRYPGNDYVDVLSVTGYSSSERKGYMTNGDFATYNFFCATGKPMGFSEISARTGNWQIAGSTPRSSWYNTIQSVYNLFPRISWLCAWGNGGYSTVNNAGNELLQENVGTSGNDDGLFWYTSPYAINLAELPDYKVGVINNPGIAQLFTTADRSGQYVGLEERVYNAADLKKLGIDIQDIRSIHVTDGYTISLCSETDGNGDTWDYTNNLYQIGADVAAKAKSLKIGSGTNLAFEKDVWTNVGEENAWKINDGSIAAWEATADDKGEAWIVMDLGDTYMLDYYVLQLAGAGDMLAMYNLRDFRIEYSTDGENWTVADTYTDNTASSVTNVFRNKIARYLRLYITKANSSALEIEKNDIFVCEWEVYGVKYTAPPTEEDTSSDEEQENSSEDTSYEDEEPSEDVSADEDDAENVDDTLSDEVSDDTLSDESGDVSDDYVAEDEIIGDDYVAEDDEVIGSEEDNSLIEEDTESDDQETKPTQVVKVKKRRPVTNWAFIYGMIAAGAAAVIVAAAVIILIIRKKKKAQAVPEE